MARFRFGPVEVSTASLTSADIEAIKRARASLDDMVVQVPRLAPPRRYRLAVGRIVNEWGVEPVAKFVAGWPDAEGLALAKLLMQADRLRRDDPVDVDQLLIKTHAEAGIDDRGRARRKPA